LPEATGVCKFLHEPPVILLKWQGGRVLRCWGSQLGNLPFVNHNARIPSRFRHPVRNFALLLS
jgi:hypothetical protein